MSVFSDLGKRKLVFGLIHLKPLPGTPLFEEGNLEISLEKAIKDAQALSTGGADGCLVQTVDRIYPSGDDTDYARLAAMTLITHEVRKATPPDFQIGAQMMWNCITPSLAVAKVCGASFTRCSAFVGTTASPYGIMNANPEKVQSYRNRIGAGNVAMIAEIEGYHFQWLNTDLPIEGKARMAMTVGADAVEILHADEEVNNKMVHDIKAFNPNIPVVLGGQTNLENCARRMKDADAVLVGSCFENGKWGGNVDANTVKEYVGIIRSLEK